MQERVLFNCQINNHLRPERGREWKRRDAPSHPSVANCRQDNNLFRQINEAQTSSTPPRRFSCGFASTHSTTSPNLKDSTGVPSHFGLHN